MIQLRLTFSNSFLYFFTIYCILAIQVSSLVSKSITDTVVLNPETVFAPSTPREYLRSGLYYGGKRSSLAADDLLTKAFNFGLPIRDYQFVAKDSQDDEQSFIPDSPENPIGWQGDASSIYQACVSDSFQDQVNRLNTDCGVNCSKTYLLVAIWGNLQGMNWDQSFILFHTCGIISVVNSDLCFNNFPDSCSIHFHGEENPLFTGKPLTSGAIAEFGVPAPKTRAQLIQEVKTYAQKTHQTIALPSH